MPIEIQCPNCTRKYAVTEKHIGRKVVCADTVCGTRFIATVEQLKEDAIDPEVFFEAVDNPPDDNEVESSQMDDTATVNSELSQGESDGVASQEPQTEIVPDAKERSQTQFWGMAKKVFGDASTHVSNAGIAVTSKAASYGSTGIAKATEVGKQTFNAANSAIDSSGAKEAIRATASVVSGKLDEVSGKRLVELLEKKLQIQDSYNDILATRLAEALDRIKALEDRFDKLISQSAISESSASEIQR